MDEFRPKKFSHPRGLRLFKILPIHTYQRRFITVSSEILSSLLQPLKKISLHSNQLDFTKAEFMENIKDWTWKLFNLKKIGIGSREKLDADSTNYSGTFTTDGYSICFIFNKVIGRDLNAVPVPVAPIPAAAPAQERPISMVHPDNRVTISMGELKRKSDAVNSSLQNFKRKKKKPKKLSSKEIAEKIFHELKEAIQSLGFSENDIIYGLDPGKRDLITAVGGCGNERYPTMSLSADEFYHSAGHHKFTKAR